MAGTDVVGEPDREVGVGRKLLLSAAALGSSLAVAATGTYAAFSASVADGHSVATGTAQLVLGAAGSAANRLAVDAVDLSPGDTVQRAFDLRNSGTTDLATFTLTTTGTAASPLYTDTVHGLQVRLERCTVPWTEAGSAPGYTYGCTGSRTTVLAYRPVAMTAQALSGMLAGQPGGTDHLLLTEHLPTTADNTFQGEAATVTYVVDAA